MEDTIPFATYFVERLKQCGVKYVQGVPGDYNLELVSSHPGNASHSLTASSTTLRTTPISSGLETPTSSMRPMLQMDTRESKVVLV